MLALRDGSLCRDRKDVSVWGLYLGIELFCLRFIIAITNYSLYAVESEEHLDFN